MAAKARNLTQPTISRLPIYQRIAEEALREGFKTIDSQRLGELANATPTTVRRDLLGLGKIGTRGSGYDLTKMIAAIASTLDQDTSFDVVIVGMGNLGRALANSNSFFTRGARLLACYDTSPDVIGTTINGVTIQPFAEDLVSATTGILTTPPEVAQSAAERLVSQGYTAILNFAPVVLRDLPPNVKVQYVDFSVELQVLMYQQRHQLNLGVLHPIGVTSRGHV